MRFYTKSTFFLVLVFAGIGTLTSCKSKTPWNPYLSAKEKPSDKQRKEEQKQMKKGTKNYEKQMEKNKKDIKAHRSFTTKQQYKRTTKIKRRKRSKKMNWTF